MRTRSLVAELGHPRQEFTSREFREATGTYPTGVNVITTRGPDEVYGMTASAFASVSLDPPLILICVALSAQGSSEIARNRIFAVNVLSARQEPISRYFASKERPRGPDAFREIPHRQVATGAPILEDVAGYLDCSLHATQESGDHLIFVGEVLALGVRPGIPPLAFQRGAYRLLREE